MSEKKLLTYEGLEEYNIKWHERLQAMTISDADIDAAAFEALGVDVLEIPNEWTVSSDGTLNLSTSNAYSYWPEGAGTKTISIANGTTAGVSHFFLKLTDAGNFFVEWGSSIQWKDGSEPEWQAFHEDIIMFKSDDGGSTWTGQVLQTNEIDPYWKITMQAQYVDTSKLQYSVPSDYGYFCYLPFPVNYLPSDTIIDWGDGVVQTYDQLEYNHNPYMQSEKGQQYMGIPRHRYSSEGTYHIKIQAASFDEMYMVNGVSGDMFVYDRDFSYTLGQSFITSIDSPIPHVNGIWDYYGSGVTLKNNSLSGIFLIWESLQHIPDKLFYNNKLITEFESCFGSCSSLTSIPSGLFDKNTGVTDFRACFSQCSSLQSIPQGLFDKNTAVTTFESCFSSCSSLQSIPQGLFDKNTAVTSFNYCFSDCTSLNNFTLHISSSSVSNCSSFVTSKSGTTRTIYVPSGSTTQTKFNAIASSLGLTIIGE